jgi:hypothetical protein
VPNSIWLRLADTCARLQTVQDIRSIAPNRTTLVVTSYKGYVTPLLDNKHHKAELIRMVGFLSG